MIYYEWTIILDDVVIFLLLFKMKFYILFYCIILFLLENKDMTFA